MTEKERLIAELENYEPYAAHFPHLTVDGKLILDILRFLRGKPELKFFVDSDGKMTPLPVQKHGHWIKVEEGFTDMMCSECGELALLDLDRDFVLSKYCPNCGAKMDEEVKQNETD